MTIGVVLGLALGGMLLAAAPAGAREGGPAPAARSLEKATFAGGCFWCMESPFDKLEGVVSVTVGYTGGRTVKPTYEEVSSGGTGHAESIEIVFDPAKISYRQLLDVYWHNVDPTMPNRQFCDVGTQYRTAIFYHSEQQKRLAEESKKALEESKVLPGPIVTEIVPAGTFWPAEEYHEHYYRKNPIRYKFYRSSCGRDRRLEELWGRDAGHRAAGGGRG